MIPYRTSAAAVATPKVNCRKWVMSASKYEGLVTARTIVAQIAPLESPNARAKRASGSAVSPANPM